MATTAHGHRHGRTCYWDHLRCGWVCAAPPAEPVVDVEAGLDRVVDDLPPARVPAEPQPA